VWKTYTVADGLPSDEVFAIRVDGERVWAGTTGGLALFEKGRWRSYGTADGLPHRVVLALDVSPRTGDLWVGTMGGLARVSAGRLDVFNQTNSGLATDFVNSVRCDPEDDIVWAATAMGISRLELRTGTWSIFNHQNTPMHEPWTYSVSIAEGKVFVGAWGGGVLEYTAAAGRWREYRDPDREFELDLLPDDGPVSDVTASLDASGSLLWVATYFGLARYDGRTWRTYFAEDSGLAGNFINFVRADGASAWLATDQGLSLTDGEDWVTHRRLPDGRGEIRFFEGGREVARRITPTALGHSYVLGVDTRGDEVWAATGRGVSVGRRSGAPGPGRRAAPGRQAPAAATEPVARFRYAGTPEELLPFRGMTPYRQFFTEPPQFRGPGRDASDPDPVERVNIGFIGPLAEEDNPLLPPGARSATARGPRSAAGRRMLRAALLAVQDANAAGGYRGKIPFQIVPRTDQVVWGQTSGELVRLAQEEGAWAVVTSIDSNHNHVISRVTLKAEIPVVNAGSTDPTLVEHSIPWLIRLAPDDRQQAYALLHEIFRERNLRRVAVLRASDRDGRMGVAEFLQGARRLGHPVVLEKRFDPGDREFREPLARIRETSPEALVLWGDPEETGAAVRQAREMGLTIPIFGFDRMASPEFLKAAGPAAEGVVAAATMNPDRDDPAWRDFRERYQTRWGEDPDGYAARTYDATRLILLAIGEAGLNRPRIRDALAARTRYAGASGEIRLDTNLNNIARPWIATIRDGRFRYAAARSWPGASDPEGAAPGSR
jgi:ABC-type branched-subunit amino acid transport system substrate-binding protein